jgi:hypothetical protein
MILIDRTIYELLTMLIVILFIAFGYVFLIFLLFLEWEFEDESPEEEFNEE